MVAHAAPHCGFDIQCTFLGGCESRKIDLTLSGPYDRGWLKRIVVLEFPHNGLVNVCFAHHKMHAEACWTLRIHLIAKLTTVDVL